VSKRRVACPECHASVWYEHGEIAFHRAIPDGRINIGDARVCHASYQRAVITPCEACGGHGAQAKLTA
jgi:hypothetical protein